MQIKLIHAVLIHAVLIHAVLIIAKIKYVSPLYMLSSYFPELQDLFREFSWVIRSLGALSTYRPGVSLSPEEEYSNQQWKKIISKWPLKARPLLYAKNTVFLGYMLTGGLVYILTRISLNPEQRYIVIRSEQLKNILLNPESLASTLCYWIYRRYAQWAFST